MATVIKQLWGIHPPFLKLRTKKSLSQLIRHLPKQGVGYKVQPTEWFKKGKDAYYQITKYEGTNIYGIKVRNGLQEGNEGILQEKFNNWAFYSTREFIETLKTKLSK
ncbi:hypothetical protein HDV01_001161 [Terramyces sp. JEL0728]|nr:hypothetical protein HDV01_001161 [Terramyces sp. JEL0728]